MKLRKGVLKVQKELKEQRIKTAVVSDLTTHIQLRKMDKLRISKYIDFLVTSEEAGSEKPHAVMFLLALINEIKRLVKATIATVKINIPIITSAKVKPFFFPISALKLRS